MTLQPQASFTVVRQIANHTDAGTYYVRAVIRNAYTDELIETLDLTSRGSQRFSKNWQVPADVSGQGFYISIVTSVYTDSGYTTKSENYGDEETTYLVQDRLLGTRSGGGGPSLYDIRRVIKEELEKLPKPEKVEIPAFPSIPTYDMRWDEVLYAVKTIPSAIQFPQPEQVDLEPLMESIQSALQAIESKEVTPETDLEPVLARMNQIEAHAEQIAQDTTAAIEALPAKMEEVLATVELNIAPTKAKTEKKKEEPVPFDPSSLTL